MSLAAGEAPGSGYSLAPINYTGWGYQLQAPTRKKPGKNLHHGPKWGVGVPGPARVTQQNVYFAEYPRSLAFSPGGEAAHGRRGDLPPLKTGSGATHHGRPPAAQQRGGQQGAEPTRTAPRGTTGRPGGRGGGRPEGRGKGPPPRSSLGREHVCAPPSRRRFCCPSPLLLTPPSGSGARDGA